MPRTTLTTQDTRDSLLQAANRVILRDGSGKLTLEAVAREANVSKGGLLYHFPNKQSLIVALLSSDLEKFERRLQNDLDGTPGAWTRAYVRPMLDGQPAPDELETNAAVIAAITENPALLEPFREKTREWQEKSEHDGLEPALATLLRLAADGLYFAELFDLGAPQGELRSRVLERILEMATPSTPKKGRAR